MPEGDWKTLQGAVDTLWPQALKLLIQIVGIMAFARLLSPEQFGISAVFLIVANFIDLLRDRGLSVYALQNQDFGRLEQVRTFWMWISSALLLSIFTVIIFCILLIFTDFKYLIAFCFLVPLYLLLNCFQGMIQILMIKSGRFLELGLSETAGQIMGFLVGLIIALKTHSYLALLSQIFVAQASTVMLRNLRLKWRPGKPQLVFCVDKESQASNKLMFSQIVAFLGNNLDSILITGRLGLIQGGIYNRLWTITVNSANQILNPLSSVVISRLVRLRDNPKDFHALQYAIYCWLVLFIVLGISIFIPNSVSILNFILGSTWSLESGVFNALCIAVLFQGGSLFNYCYMVATKANSKILRVSYLSKVFSLFTLILGLNFGMIGIASSLAFSSFVTWVMGLFMMLGLSRKTFINYVLPVALSLSGLYLGIKLNFFATQIFDFPEMIEFILGMIITSSLACFLSFAIRSVRDVFTRRKPQIYRF